MWFVLTCTKLHMKVKHTQPGIKILYSVNFYFACMLLCKYNWITTVGIEMHFQYQSQTLIWLCILIIEKPFMP